MQNNNITIEHMAIHFVTELCVYVDVVLVLFLITAVPAKSDSDVTFCFKAIRDLESIDHLFINPIHRIGLIHKCSLDSRWLKWIVQVNVYLTIVNKLFRHCHLWLARQYILLI